jgi:tRNA nucleotidyltransferase (CCA-adding enzyme)
MKKTDSVLKVALEKVRPEEENIKIIEEKLFEFLKKFRDKVKAAKISAEAFVGGSFAKGTVMKKDSYDVDIFIRFDKKYKESELAGLTKRLLKDFEGVKTIHGSRDYFQMDVSDKICFEIVPVIKVAKPVEARNITDLSYSHVKYLNRKVKSKKIKEQIILAKAFCYATKTYGAESYIKGFSGYSLELLIYYYKSLEKFLRAAIKNNGKEKLIIDISKKYRNKKRILLDMNGSKLESPIILIDPTFKQRNVMAALSDETFAKFIEEAKRFLKNPSEDFFDLEKVDLKKVKIKAKKDKLEFVSFSASTNKQEGDIAGSKLLKFYNHLGFEISKYFEIKNRGFDYGKKQSAEFFFVVKPLKEVLVNGPFIEDKVNVKKFKKEHTKTFIKSKKVYAKAKVDFSLEQFVKKWKVKNKKKISEMYVQGFEVC